MKRLLLMGIAFFSSVLAAACVPSQSAEPPMVMPASPTERPVFTDPVLIEGERNYNLYCAHCHGYDGQGQLPDTIENTVNLGMSTVPAHNHTGVTWKHAEPLLIRTVLEGVPNPIAMYPMPAYQGILTETQIKGILTYIKLWWTQEQRDYHDRVTQNWIDAGASLNINPDSMITAPTTAP